MAKFRSLVICFLMMFFIVAALLLWSSQNVRADENNNLELLDAYSRLLLLYSSKSDFADSMAMKQEFFEFKRLYLQTKINPSCIDQSVSAKRVLCRAKFFNNANDSDANMDGFDHVVVKKVSVDSELCRVQISRGSCSNLLQYKGKVKLKPNFKKIDTELKKAIGDKN